jgi:glycosyltransferase involved in cell wall biosynthesis
LPNQQPLISAYIPTHNRAESLERAINSVLEQTWKHIEVVVVDDASDDETPKLLTRMSKEYPITIIRNNSAKGAAASRNTAIEHAKGEFVAGLDDDDFWRPKRIELLMENFEEGYSAVCSNDRMVFGEKEIVWKKKPVITLQDLLFYNQVGNQVLTKKKYIQAVGGYDENLPSAQDYDLWIRLAHDYGPVKNAPHTLQVVNMAGSRESITTSGHQIDGYLACYEKHKHRMNPRQKTYQQYRIKMAAGEPVSWFEMFRSVPSYLLVKEITRKLFL